MDQQEKVIDLSKEHVLNNKVLSAEEQASLTPERVIEILKEGNKEFVEDRLTIRNNTERVRNASLGQYPKAVIVSCLDSRVPVEDVFHRGIGDVFVARVAGNIINEDILGSLEYACKVSGVKLVMILGHEHCGAISSAVKNTQLGNITQLLSKIQPAVKMAKETFKGEIAYSNPDFLEAVCYQNVENGIKEVRKNSPILKKMEDNGEIKIIGGVYDMESGKVDFMS